jgi:DNA-directed RNA polymerase subunit RPC12/RpoP
MKCANCKTVFPAADQKPRIGRDSEGDAVEINIKCPRCGDRFYAITTQWFSLRDVQRLVQKYHAQNKEAA